MALPSSTSVSTSMRVRSHIRPHCFVGGSPLTLPVAPSAPTGQSKGGSTLCNVVSSTSLLTCSDRCRNYDGQTGVVARLGFVGRSMDIEDKRKIGEQIEPGDRPRAPGRLELLQRFVNTWNHDLPETWDRIGTRDRAHEWLRKNGLIARHVDVSAEDAARLRACREALRSIIGANGGEAPDPTAIHALRAASRAGMLTVTIDERGRTSLQAAGPATDGAIALLLGIMHDAQLTGDWARLKGCRRCRYAFYDRSRNRSAAWCSMSICGNRSKNRAYYRRINPPA